MVIDAPGDIDHGKHLTVAGTVATAPAEEAANDREVRLAIAIAGGLYFVGGSLCASAALLPHVSSPIGVTAVALDAYLTAALLLVAARRGWGGLGLACIADLWGVVLIAVLCASSGGPDSPFALIYFFALGHAAAFQPRGRFVLVAIAALLAFLAPLAYEPHVSSMFGAIACVGIVLALLTSIVLHASLSRLREQRRLLEILIAATARLDKSLDPSETLRTIVQMAVPDLAELCVIDLLDHGGSIGTTVAASADPAVAAEVERLRKAFPLDVHANHPVTRVLAGDLPHVIYDSVNGASPDQPIETDPHARFMREVRTSCVAVFPMVARGRTHGVISFSHLGSAARYDGDLLAVLEDLAGRAGMAFDNARLYAERAQVARTLQRSLIPAVLPEIPGLELASYFRPMGAGNEVGGDFYDAFGDCESCWLVVGDVCGKGAEAAALTGFLRHTTAAYAREDSSPREVLSQVNQAMLGQGFDGRFATAIVVHLRARGDGFDVAVAVAGHPAAVLARSDGRVEELGGRGALLGVFPDPVIEEVSTVLEPGDVLALYTDGLAEAHAPNRVVTVQEMIEQLEKVPRASATDAIEALLRLIDLGEDVRDDIAILVARIDSDPTGCATEAHVPA
jgi:hypothetical protein